MFELIGNIIARVRTDRHPIEIRKITLDNISYQFFLQEARQKIKNVTYPKDLTVEEMTFMGCEIKESHDHNIFYLKIN